MVKNEGLEVYLARYPLDQDPHRYLEHEAPQTSFDPPPEMPQSSYVEAYVQDWVDGVLVVTPEFDFHGSPEIIVSCLNDSFHFSDTKLTLSAHEVQEDILAQGFFTTNLSSEFPIEAKPESKCSPKH